MVGIFKEYHFYFLCYWHHILAFSVELYSVFKLQISGSVAIFQRLSFQIRCTKLNINRDYDKWRLSYSK